MQKCSEETLEKIWSEYEAEQLHEVNAQLTEVLIDKFSRLLKEFDFVKDKVKLQNDRKSNELLKKGMENCRVYYTIQSSCWFDLWWRNG